MSLISPDLFIDWLPACIVTSPTSREAAKSIRPSAKHLRERVYAVIKSCGEYGATDEEIQKALGMEGNTERPRRRELEIEGRISKIRLGPDIYSMRVTESGRYATVWVCT